tara:strand:+ start:1676 stop:3103 length:1428 start_codon:yes stop_codon:yes gene_type:complete
MSPNVKYSLYLILIILILFLLDKYVDIKKEQKQKIVENMSNMNNTNKSNKTNNYTKYEDTIIGGAMKGTKLRGTLDQAKDSCNSDDKCIGIIRKNVEEGKEDDYYKIEKIDVCINKYNKLPEFKKDKNNKKEENKTTNLIYGNTFSDYSTYLKEETDSSVRCIRLDTAISIKHLKYPFDRLVSDNELNIRSKSVDDIVENKNESSDGKIYSRNGIFHIVKGLTGEGISFKITKNNEEYYLVNMNDTEDITVSMLKEDSSFKRNATFHLDLNYVVNSGIEDLENSEKTKYISIKKVENNRNYFWKINDINKKIILINQEDIKDDNDSINTVLFEIIQPLEYTESSKEIVVPAPSIEETKEEELPDREEKKKTLEKLEIDIRELQHKQNLKLMDVMVDVNKFKLMDLSLSDYLTKCTRNSSDQNINAITTNINNTNNTNNNSNTNINNNNLINTIKNVKNAINNKKNLNNFQIDNKT